MLQSVCQQLPKRLKLALRSMRMDVLSVRLPRQKNFQQSEDEAQAGVSISVIVTISGPYDNIRRCLVSLEEYASHSEIILVDDGTPQKVAEMLKGFQASNGWKLIRHDYPLGHSRATEVGARIATRPLLCLLNSD